MEQTDWKNFWEHYRNVEFQDEKDLFFQVGKTINKEPISATMFARMLENIRFKLDLQKSDILLELCCGNGLLTKPLSHLVKTVYASDFTEHLIATAKMVNQQDNITYAVADAKLSPEKVFLQEISASKILMNDALSCFDVDDLIAILKNIGSQNYKFYITGIPNDALKWNFYNTPERKSHYESLIAKGDQFLDGIGRWWKKEELEVLAKELNLICLVENQPEDISNFRMNALFIKE